MKTLSKLLSPFTLYTIPITSEISVLILVEVIYFRLIDIDSKDDHYFQSKNSLACANLMELINQLNVCISHFQLSFKKLNAQVRAVENNIITRRFVSCFLLLHSLISTDVILVRKSKFIHSYFAGYIDEYTRYLQINLEKLRSNRRRSSQVMNNQWTHQLDEFFCLFIDRTDEILAKLESMNDLAMDIFHQAYLSADEQTRGLTASTSETNRLDSTMLQALQNRLFQKLGDWLSFIEARAQGNITISLYVFHGIVVEDDDEREMRFLVVRMSFLVWYILHWSIVHVVEFVHRHYSVKIIEIISSRERTTLTSTISKKEKLVHRKEEFLLDKIIFSSDHHLRIRMSHSTSTWLYILYDDGWIFHI